MPYQIEYKTKEVNGLQLFYRVFGSDAALQTMVILHGWNTVGSQSWEPFINLFQSEVGSGKLRIIAPDMPGFAQSESPKAVWQAENYAQYISQFIIEINISNIVLVGHSFGGAVGSIIASQHPEIQLDYLYLVAPAIVRNWGEKQSQKQKVTKFGKHIFTIPILKPFVTVARKLWYKLIGSPDYIKTSGIMSEIMSGVVKHDIQYTLNRIAVPTTIIWGDRDIMTPVRQAKLVQSQISDSELVVLSGVNHGIHIHANPELKKIILERLDL